MKHKVVLVQFPGKKIRDHPAGVAAWVVIRSRGEQSIADKKRIPTEIRRIATGDQVWRLLNSGEGPIICGKDMYLGGEVIGRVGVQVSSTAVTSEAPPSKRPSVIAVTRMS